MLQQTLLISIQSMHRVFSFPSNLSYYIINLDPGMGFNWNSLILSSFLFSVPHRESHLAETGFKNSHITAYLETIQCGIQTPDSILSCAIIINMIIYKLLNFNFLIYKIGVIIAPA